MAEPQPQAKARGGTPFGRGETPLFLAPMEGLADRAFRQAIAETSGGFTESYTEFIRVPGVLPTNARAERYIPKLVSGFGYDRRELGSVPLAPQIMGSDPALLAEAVRVLAGPQYSAHRVDLNCGCPSNIVTGNGAGSSLLRTPELLHRCVSAMRAAADPFGALVSVKVRSGFDDSSRFRENLLAAAEAGADFVAVHPRTRRQGYSGAADWSLIAVAKQTLSIPVIGNGDVTSAARARLLLSETGCDGVMVGRGAVQDPLIFRRIRAALDGRPWDMSAAEEAAIVARFIRAYHANLSSSPKLHRKAASKGGRGGGGGEPRQPPVVGCSGEAGEAAGDGAAGGPGGAFAERALIGRLKQLATFLLRCNDRTEAALQPFLEQTNTGPGSAQRAMEQLVEVVSEHWTTPQREVAVDNFSARKAYSGPVFRTTESDHLPTKQNVGAAAAAAVGAAAVEEAGAEAGCAGACS